MAFDLNTFNSRLSTLRTLGSLINGLGGSRRIPDIQYQQAIQAPAQGGETGQVANQSELRVPIEKDWRVRLSLPENSTLFYNRPEQFKGILAPLHGDSEISYAGGSGANYNIGVGRTYGVIFPYTPQITVTHAASYDSSATVHSNYTNYFYKNSEVQAIQISGEFTVQNTWEGQYLLAVIYFLRAATKMFFGNDNSGENYVGNPPPILYLDGYGKHYFPHVPCILTNFSHTLPPDVDYVSVMPSDGPELLSGTVTTAKTPEDTRLPTSSSISITVQPIYSRSRVFTDFNLNSFASGDLLDKGFL